MGLGIRAWHTFFGDFNPPEVPNAIINVFWAARPFEADPEKAISSSACQTLM